MVLFVGLHHQSSDTMATESSDQNNNNNGSSRSNTFKPTWKLPDGIEDYVETGAHKKSTKTNHAATAAISLTNHRP